MTSERLLFDDDVHNAEQKEPDYESKRICTDCREDVRDKDSVFVTSYDVIYCQECWNSYPKPDKSGEGDDN